MSCYSMTSSWLRNKWTFTSMLDVHVHVQVLPRQDMIYCPPSPSLSLPPTPSPHTLNSMSDLILSELRLQEALHHLSISPSFFNQLLAVPMHSQSSSFAVDVRSDSVIVSSVMYSCSVKPLIFEPLSCSVSDFLVLVHQ